VRRILIAGCGYVGTAAADLFQAAGWLVEGWTHSTVSAAQLLNEPYPVATVDLTDRHQVNCRPQNFDMVIHCASTRGGDADSYRRLYQDGMQNLLDRFVGSTLLFTSSSSVYAQQNGEAVTEESPTEPLHEKGQILADTERLVLASGGIVARLAGIHGPGRSAILTSFLRGAAVIDPGSDRFLNHVHRDDIASALALLADAPAHPKPIYNVVDDKPIVRSECYQWLRQKLGRELSALPPGSEPRKRGRSNKRVLNAKLRDLGWTPRYPTFAIAMEESILPSFGL
jgi:nucleoside-diphosphate-sugar epimerase